MPASRFLEIVKKPAKFQSAVSMCQFLSPGTTLYAYHAFSLQQALTLAFSLSLSKQTLAFSLSLSSYWTWMLACARCTFIAVAGINVTGADGHREQYPSFVPFFVLMTVGIHDASAPLWFDLQCWPNLSRLPHQRCLFAQHLAWHTHLVATPFGSASRMSIACSRRFLVSSWYPAYPPVQYAWCWNLSMKYGVARARLVLFATTSSTNTSCPALPCLPYLMCWSVSWK